MTTSSPEHRLQARDAGDARLRQGAAAVAFRAALGERQPLFGDDVGTGQQVVVARARQALDRFVGVERAELRGLSGSRRTRCRG